jgi:hypothetical protein
LEIIVISEEEFGAAFGAGLAEHVLAVVGDSVCADGQAACYLLGAEARSYMVEDFFFTVREASGDGRYGSIHSKIIFTLNLPFFSVKTNFIYRFFVKTTTMM